MIKLYYKFKKYSNKKGFTLVELLAVIVVLAIIMLIAIPAVLDVMHAARRKSFVTYVDRIGSLSSQKFMKDNIEGKSSGCYIYNIKDDFDLSNTGSFKGYVLVNSNSTEIKYYITLWNDDYMLVAYNYTDGINYKGQKKIIDESLEKYDSTRNEDIKPGTLCNYACNICTYEGASNDPYDNSGDTSLEGDITKIKGATTLLASTGFKNKVNSLAGSLDNVLYIRKANTLNEEATKEIISAEDESSKNNPVYIWFENNTVYFYTEATKIFFNSDSNNFFSLFYNLIDLDDFLENVYTDKLSNANYMFYNCQSLTKLDLSNWNTNNLKKIYSIFNHCIKLKSLNVSTWNISNVEELAYTFAVCESLTNINVSNWNTSNIKQLKGTFFGCKSLTELDLEKWDTSNVTFMGDSYASSSLFQDCTNLVTLKLSSWNTSKVTDMGFMFANCYNLKNLDVSKWNTSNVTDMFYMFQNASSLNYIDVSNWDVRNVTRTAFMFLGCNLSTIDFSKWRTDNLKDIRGMFSGCKIEYLDLTSFSINKLTD